MRSGASTVIGLCCVCGLLTQAAAQNLSTYGTPGLIDMPTAEVLNDGELALTASSFGTTFRSTVTFQMLPWVYGSFRYSIIDGYNGPIIGNRYDRSFDLHFQLATETDTRPGIAVGLRDFGGTGIYSSEYIAITKTFADRFTLTGGMGWGRLAARNGFSNPLGAIDDRFKTRPNTNAGKGGKVNYNQWFRGDAALFGGVEWNVNDRLSLLAEYSSDMYEPERSQGVMTVDSPFNFGVSYKFDNGVGLNGYYMHGTEVGVQLSYVFDPRKRPGNAGQDPAAPALLPVDRVALASWNLPADQRAGGPDAQAVLQTRLKNEGLRLEGFQVVGKTASIRVENDRWGSSAQAAGRAGRVMANTLDPSVDKFVVTFVRNGLPITSITTNRQDYYELENNTDGAWRMLARTVIEDAYLTGQFGEVDEAYPHFGYRFGPYAFFSFFDPDAPIRYEFGAELKADLTLRPGFVLSSQFRLPVVGNVDEVRRVSDSVLPHVRSDWARYAQESDLEISHLTAEYFFRPGESLFGRMTGGYLEQMYGGFSAELLWYPVNSRVAFGGEINYARQRDFDMLLGFQDYDVVTGHASAYYDLGGDYHAQVDVGRYLAGDVGATFSLDREFNNGFKVGAFATLTNVSSDDFGEGSFDKGIRVEIPISWLTGKPSRGAIKQTIRPVLRDGGARLSVRNRLYEYTRNDRSTKLAGQWGRFFK